MLFIKKLFIMKRKIKNFINTRRAKIKDVINFFKKDNQIITKSDEIIVINDSKINANSIRFPRKLINRGKGSVCIVCNKIKNISKKLLSSKKETLIMLSDSGKYIPVTLYYIYEYGKKSNYRCCLCCLNLDFKHNWIWIYRR